MPSLPLISGVVWPATAPIEVIEFAAIRFGIALEKEVQRLVADDPVGTGENHGSLDHVPGLQGPLRPESLDALIVTVDRTPAVRDLAQGTRFHA